MFGTSEAWQFISQGGLGALAFVLLLGGAKRWWVFGWQAAQLEKERDEWKDLALRLLGATERTADALIATRRRP